ncbi:L-rhamnose-proton symporter [Pontiella desulfatans]|uniref:L-rhamnose-proton symporter n=1 Tax=Pontiella desulfatans TaxID=2750659 RepID=A0A6C2U217_PONDE|nr:L-rhamnose/proton symporter RhaT [Pontiella desulfatans]VGO14012.1 L-rhamnose-proton symporter [Pontiella desulfatans]
MVALGVFLHAVGGFAAGSFYLPLKKVREWSWESGWLVNGFFSWIIAPIVMALLTVPELFGAILSAPPAALGWTFLFGLLWGIGGLTFGLSVRYLGMSLGYGVALGFCAAFGTLVPAIYDGSIIRLLTTGPGWVVLSGILVCLIGIGICGYAGHLKESALTKEEEDKQDFHLGRGLLVAGFAGLMSACMAFAFAAGKPIAEAAAVSGTGALWVNNAALVVILLGGFTTNAVWCGYLLRSKGSWKDFADNGAPRTKNFSFAALAGVTWYLQFMFYGMGSTKMGEYDFTSWTLHMSFVIMASNLWSLYLKEWEGTGRKTIGTLVAGILVIAFSTVLIGLGNWMQGASAAH